MRNAERCGHGNLRWMTQHTAPAADRAVRPGRATVSWSQHWSPPAPGTATGSGGPVAAGPLIGSGGRVRQADRRGAELPRGGSGELPRGRTRGRRRQPRVRTCNTGTRPELRRRPLRSPGQRRDRRVVAGRRRTRRRPGARREQPPGRPGGTSRCRRAARRPAWRAARGRSAATTGGRAGFDTPARIAGEMRQVEAASFEDRAGSSSVVDGRGPRSDGGCPDQGGRASEWFSDRSRRVLVAAQDEVRLLRHRQIGPQHLLLGLPTDSDGLAAITLASRGLSLYQAASGGEVPSRRAVCEGRTSPASDEAVHEGEPRRTSARKLGRRRYPYLSAPGLVAVDPPCPPVVAGSRSAARASDDRRPYRREVAGRTEPGGRPSGQGPNDPPGVA